MKALLDTIVNAITTKEGFFQPSSLPARDNNPGDLRNAPWLQHPVIAGGFWKAPSLESGIAGIYHQVALDIARGMSLKKLIYSWAPSSDNNQTEQYLFDVCHMTGIIDVDLPLQNLLEIHHLDIPQSQSQSQLGSKVTKVKELGTGLVLGNLGD